MHWFEISGIKKKHYAGDSKEIGLSLWVIIYMKLIDTQKSKSKKKDAMLLSAFNLAMDRPRRVIRHTPASAYSIVMVRPILVLYVINTYVGSVWTCVTKSLE